MRALGGRRQNRRMYALVLGCLALLVGGLLYVALPRRPVTSTAVTPSVATNTLLPAPESLIASANGSYGDRLPGEPTPPDTSAEDRLRQEVRAERAARERLEARLSALEGQQPAAPTQTSAPKPDPDAERRKQDARAEAKRQQEELKARRSAPFNPLLSANASEPKTGGIKVFQGTPVLGAGTHIACILDAGINSEHGREVVARVSAPVDDSLDPHRVVIPQDAELLGHYQQVAFGDDTLNIAWDAVQYQRPDRLVYIPLNRQPGGDRTGQAGLPGEIDHKWWRLVTSLALRSVVEASSAGIAMAGGSAGERIGGAAAQQVVREGGSQVTRTLNVTPTIRVPAGTGCSATLKEPLAFPAL